MKTPAHSARYRRAQIGQAIPLIAMMMVVLLGLLGLAMDSGRGYVDRRELQNSDDAATLAAADYFQNYGDSAGASQLGVSVYAQNERIANVGSPTYFASNPQTYSFPSDLSHSLSIAITQNNFAGTVFTLTAKHYIPLSIMQVLGLGSQLSVSVIAKAVVGNQSSTPALLTLDQTCPGGSSLTLQGSTTVTVHGDIYSDGGTSMGGSSGFIVAGNAYSRCDPNGALNNITYYCYNADPTVPPYPPPCFPGDQVGGPNAGAPIIPDPGYPGGNASLYPNVYGAPGNNVELQPGTYTGFSINGGGGCDWLAPGIYTMQSGFTDHGHQTSNMLKPPDEPVWYDNTQRAATQFFDAGGCAPNPGFTLASVVSGAGGTRPLKPANNVPGWGIEVTSVRADWYPPSGQPGAADYRRESAPSMCRTIPIDGVSKGFQITINKLLGAQGYNIYASPSGCSGPFGYIGTLNIGSSYPSSVTSQYDSSNVPTPFNPSGVQCAYPTPGVFVPSQPPVGCAPPDGETAPYSQVFAYTNQALSSGSTYNAIAVDSAQGFTVGMVVTLANGTGKNQSLVVAAGSGATTLSVNPFVALNNYPINAYVAGPFPSPAIPNGEPPKGILPRGDRANENQCWSQATGNAIQPCNGATVTPGGVQFQFPTTNDCLDENGNGGTEIFSGRQYDFIVLWFSPQNQCSPRLNGGSFTQYIGTMYMPAANLTINGGNKAPVAGQVIAYTTYFSGNAGISIDYNPDTAPAPPAARLIL